MTLLLFLAVTLLAPSGEILEVKTNVPRPPRAATVKAVADTASTGKSLAEALERLQRPSSQQSMRNRYRVVTLLGGKLSARVPIR